jgi:hypothetical protein
VNFYRPILLEKDEVKAYNINIRIRKEKLILRCPPIAEHLLVVWAEGSSLRATQMSLAVVRSDKAT